MEKSVRNIIIAMVAVLTFSTTSLAANNSDDAIAERIKPVGQVYLASDVPVVEEPTGPRSGEQVYNTFCIACHATGAAAGAPKTQNAEDWAPRIAKGMDTLKDHALNGFNAMPAKGSCMNCSDDEVIAAVEHLIKGL
ncbi:cytochrome c5 family protein [Aliivibrio fischeri]|uniref:c-type cytochrome n=1 Tax=Aliivibrio fischeri TaxID=668 RepID=UPI001F26DD2A|nr:cytochrome c5 family protein [Aliivibrio fischeri]MCE7579488.1 cytochrome c5 family protein [Aliivibrio fischeri]MCE7591775.1 cytochrome c5 family protein [Aliivibrio fischeri]